MKKFDKYWADFDKLYKCKNICGNILLLNWK